MGAMKNYLVELELLQERYQELLNENKELTNRLNRASEHITILQRENKKLKEEYQKVSYDLLGASHNLKLIDKLVSGDYQQINRILDVYFNRD